MAIQISGTTVIDNSRNVITGAAASVTCGDAFVKAHAVGVGTTNTAGRNAGVGTAQGTLILNVETESLEMYGPAGWKVVKSVGVLNATGGTKDTTSRSGYAVHTFTSPGTFTVNSGQGDVEYLVIAGGGAGGYYGGGGAGGYRSGTLSVTPGGYPVTRGGGGTTPANTSVPGPNGSNSVFGTITSTGGGGGASQPGYTGPGGSGGGGYNAAGGTGTVDEGNDGGAGNTDATTYTAGGGGGGAGGAGGDASTPISRQGGDGGAGSTSSITGSPVARGGGGGGATNNNYTPGPATAGGGPGGNNNVATTNRPGGIGISGTAETGGGGGGGNVNAPTAGGPGGLGGSGVVIVAYPIA